MGVVRGEWILGRGGLRLGVEGVRKTAGEVGLEESTEPGEDHVTNHVTSHGIMAQATIVTI